MFSTVYLKFPSGLIYSHGFFFPDGVDPVGKSVYLPKKSGGIKEIARIEELIVIKSAAYLALANDDAILNNRLDEELAAAGWQLETFAELFPEEKSQKEPSTLSLPLVGAAPFHSSVSSRLFLGYLFKDQQTEVARTSQYRGYTIGVRRSNEIVRLAKATKKQSNWEFQTVEMRFSDFEEALLEASGPLRPGRLIDTFLSQGDSVIRNQLETLEFLGIATFVYPSKTANVPEE